MRTGCFSFFGHLEPKRMILTSNIKRQRLLAAFPASIVFIGIRFTVTMG